MFFTIKKQFLFLNPAYKVCVCVHARARSLCIGFAITFGSHKDSRI